MMRNGEYETALPPVIKFLGPGTSGPPSMSRRLFVRPFAFGWRLVFGTGLRVVFGLCAIAVLVVAIWAMRPQLEANLSQTGIGSMNWDVVTQYFDREQD